MDRSNRYLTLSYVLKTTTVLFDNGIIKIGPISRLISSSAIDFCAKKGEEGQGRKVGRCAGLLSFYCYCWAASSLWHSASWLVHLNQPRKLVKSARILMQRKDTMGGPAHPTAREGIWIVAMVAVADTGEATALDTAVPAIITMALLDTAAAMVAATMAEAVAEVVAEAVVIMAGAAARAALLVQPINAE